MARRRANKKLYALDAEVESLERERRALEIQALGAEVPDSERRARYFAIEDLDLRRKLIGRERVLHELRQRQHAAAIGYWTTVAEETRRKLDDLKSDAPTSAWRRGIWWDILTILWIIGGAGWLAYQLPGAAVGALITAVWGWFIVRSRERGRAVSIRQGEGILHSSESELRRARQEAARVTPAEALFSAAEEETGMADGA